MMRWVMLAALMLPAAAWAQNTAPVPLPSPEPPAASPAPAAPALPPVPPETWLPRGTVDLAGLDKITTRLSPLTGHIGQKLQFGTLSITVRSCIVRGPDQPADQAAFLDVTDDREPNFAFHGWMLLSAPGVSVLEHPVYDIHLVGCRP